MRIPFAVLLAAFSAVPAAAADPAPNEPRTWVLLVAVRDHDVKDYDGGVENAIRDAGLLRDTLRDRAGVPAEQILEITSDSPDDRKPTLANFRRLIPPFLARAAEGDRFIVFFAGHGQIEDDVGYLCPSGIKVGSMNTTAFPMAEMRAALAKCKASVKFLVLDCCRSGAAGRDLGGPTGKPAQLARSLDPKNEVKGTVILAACKDDQKSFEWKERGHGIFTYWLCRGLEGAADANGDGKVTFEEVYAYAYDRVPATARLVGREQNPVRIVREDVLGTPHLLALRPTAPPLACDWLAAHLDVEIRHRKLASVGVLEFTEVAVGGERLSRSTLPGYTAEQLRRALEKRAGKDYVVAPAAAVAVAARGAGVIAAAGNDKPDLDPLNKAGTAAVVVGSLDFQETVVRVQCRLLDTRTRETLVRPTAVMTPSEELLADAGASFVMGNRPAGSPYAPGVVGHVRRQAAEAHPLKQNPADRLFDVSVFRVEPGPGEKITELTKRTKKELVDPGAGGDMVFGGTKGEVVEFRVENRSGNEVGAVVMVDGVNTNGGLAQRLEEAWMWVLPAGGTGVFDGWYGAGKPIGEDRAKFPMNRFEFKDVAPVDGRTTYGQPSGVVTFAFYADAGRDLKLGKLDREEVRTLRTRQFNAGKLLGVIHLRYVDEVDLKKKLAGDP